jgi:hypothetical protein
MILSPRSRLVAQSSGVGSQLFVPAQHRLKLTGLSACSWRGNTCGRVCGQGFGVAAAAQLKPTVVPSERSSRQEEARC